MTPQSHYDHEGLQLVPNQVLPSHSSNSASFEYESVQSIEPDIYYEPGFPDKAGDRSFVNRRICGLKRRTFWIIIVVLTLVVIAAAVGGGIGGAQAAARKQEEESQSSLQIMTSASAEHATTSPTLSPSSTIIQTKTSTRTSTITASPTATDRANCPAVNNVVYQSSTNAKFKQLCSTDINGLNGAAIDIEFGFETSFNNCIDRCAVYNKANKQPPCKAVAWVLAPGDSFTACYLKNSTGIPNTKTDPKQNVAGAVLVT